MAVFIQLSWKMSPFHIPLPNTDLGVSGSLTLDSLQIIHPVSTTAQHIPRQSYVH